MPDRNDRAPDAEGQDVADDAPKAPEKPKRTVLDIIKEQQEILKPTTEVEEDEKVEEEPDVPAESPFKPSPTTFDNNVIRTKKAMEEAARLLGKKKNEDGEK